MISGDPKKVQCFNIALPVQLTRAGAKSVGQTLKTHAVGTKSVVMNCPTCSIEIGQEVEYIITLPTHGDSAPVRLWCHGRVIHSDPQRDALSVSIERHEFVSTPHEMQGVS